MEENLVAGAVSVTLSSRLDLAIWHKITDVHELLSEKRKIGMDTVNVVQGGTADSTYFYMMDAIQEWPWKRN